VACPHGFPKPENCFECMEEGNLEPPKWQKVGYPFYGKFENDCKACSENLFGRLIQRYDLSNGSQTLYVHEECKPDA
jgi:hypothetical protein